MCRPVYCPCGFFLEEFCPTPVSYKQFVRQDLRASHNASPLDSGSSAAESFTSESASSSFTEDEFHVDGRRHNNHHVPDGRRPPRLDGTTSGMYGFN